MNFLYRKFGLGHERVSGEIDSGGVQYMGGHKAFPQPKLCEIYFYEYRFEPQDYLPSI
jgi:hypothetical protein